MVSGGEGEGKGTCVIQEENEICWNCSLTSSIEERMNLRSNADEK